MIKKFSVFCLALSSALIFIRCDENQPINCFLGSISISSNSPILSGGSINLSTSSTFSDDAIYEWTGPNGFTSNLQNPVLVNTTLDMAGEYTLKVKRGICETEVATTQVDVIQNTVTCTPPNNTAIFSGISPNANFFSIVASTNSSGNFTITAADSNWRIQVVFSGNNMPTAGIYNITNFSNALTTNSVHVIATRLTFSGASFVHNAKTGDVSLGFTNNGKAIIKFCSVPFSLNNQQSTDFSCSTQYTQN